jgi:hypothetical protein
VKTNGRTVKDFIAIRTEAQQGGNGPAPAWQKIFPGAASKLLRETCLARRCFFMKTAPSKRGGHAARVSLP